MSAIGDRIKIAREQRDISQNRLAKMAGISQSGLSAIENSTKSPSVDMVALIAAALEVPLIELLDDSEQQKKPIEGAILDEPDPLDAELRSVFYALNPDDREFFLDMMRRRGKQ